MRLWLDNSLKRMKFVPSDCGGDIVDLGSTTTRQRADPGGWQGRGGMHLQLLIKLVKKLLRLEERRDLKQVQVGYRLLQEEAIAQKSVECRQQPLKRYILLYRC